MQFARKDAIHVIPRFTFENGGTLDGMKVAESELMLASGQYQAVMGQQSNETSGVAINARQRQGDNATYHYIEHQAVAIRRTGKILIELIPLVYDTPRIVNIIAKVCSSHDQDFAVGQQRRGVIAAAAEVAGVAPRCGRRTI